MHKVIEIKKDGEFILLILDRTIFHASGGGQPADFGRIENDNFTGEVVDADKEDGKISLKVKPIKGELQLGDEVQEHVDMDRRKILSRNHTGEHILFKSLDKNLPDIGVEKVRIGTEYTSFIVESASMDWELLLKAEKLVNQVIKEAKPITAHHAKKSHIQEFIDKGLRIKIDRIKEEIINVVEVEGFDLSACTGTHCKNTSDVGSILITRFNSIGKNKYEITFTVDPDEKLFELASVARRVQSVLQTDYDLLEKNISNLKEENESLKKRLRVASSGCGGNLKSEIINGITLMHETFEGLDTESLGKRMIDLRKENTLIIFFNKNGENSNVLFASNNSKLNSKDAMKIASELGAKGGGKEDFSQGRISTDKIGHLLIKIKEKLSE